MTLLTTENYKSGFVYILTNDSFPNLVKIGMTTQDNVEKRVRQMSTGVPTPFKIVYTARVNKPAEIEKALHNHFTNSRFAKNREWFAVSVSDIQHKIWEFDATVRYKDNLFSAISEYLQQKEEIESRSSNVQTFVISTAIVGFFIIIWLSTEDIISTIFSALPMSFFIYLILKGVIFTRINRYLYRNEFAEMKASVATKYTIDSMDLEKYKEHYFQEKAHESRKEYRRIKRASRK